jgi:TM2 domain-containing membrane protein YozV
MKFKILAWITAVILFGLGLGYFFFGAVIVGRWQVLPSESVILLARRIGCLYLGLSVIFFMARSTPKSSMRTALSAGTVVVTLLLAGTGVYELASGHVGKGILVSAAIEFLLAIGYIWILFTDKKDAV